MRYLLLATASLFLVSSPAALNAQGLPSRAEVAEELRERSDDAVAEFYSERLYAPVWIVNGRLSDAGVSFLSLLETADIDGLHSRDYDFEELREIAGRVRGDEDRIASAELKFMREFVRYVRDIRQPSPDLIYSDERLRRVPDEQTVLAEAARAHDFAAYVREMQFMNPAYVQLRDALLRVEARGAAATLISIPTGQTLRFGDSGPRVALLRERLGLSAGDHFDSQAEYAVARFQASANLIDDGIVGPRTLAALNGPGAASAMLLRVNLERARPLPGPWTRHVLVNAASARLSYFGDGMEQGSMKVVVGTAETPTPMMAGMLQFATLNPYWNVPVTLARKNIAPAILRGITLEQIGYEALSSWDEDARIIGQEAVDWQAVASGAEQVRLRKLPSSDNAMGTVKYQFPNDEGIYLHDTPDRHLFGERARQFSNGCVRLEDADRLGLWLFGKPLEAPSGQPEQHLVLPEAVPVYITYMTAIPADGTIAFTDDVYDMDRATDSQLAIR